LLSQTISDISGASQTIDFSATATNANAHKDKRVYVETIEGWTYRYQYDNEGRVKEETKSKTDTVQYNNTSTSTTWTYVTKYGWDHRGRLTSHNREYTKSTDGTVVDASATLVQYFYDGLNRRIGSVETVYEAPGGLIGSERAVAFVHDPTGIVMEVLLGSGGGQVLRHYARGPLGLTAVDQGDLPDAQENHPGGVNTTVWTFADSAGSVSVLGVFYDATGEWQRYLRRFNAQGAVIGEGGSDLRALKLAPDIWRGMTFDPVALIYLSESTGVQPVAGRYISQAGGDSANPYQFAGGDPVGGPTYPTWWSSFTDSYSYYINPANDFSDAHTAWQSGDYLGVYDSLNFGIGKLAGWAMFVVGSGGAGAMAGGTMLGGSTTAYVLSSTGVAAGLANGAAGTYASNPNAGIHEYAFSMGLGGGFGGINPFGAYGSLGGGLAGAGIAALAGGDVGRGYMVGDLVGGMAGGSFNDMGRKGFLHGAKFAAVEGSFAAAGGAVGYAYGGSFDSALTGANLGSMAGGAAAARWVKCFVAGTPVTVPTGAEGRWLVAGLGVLAAGVIACGAAQLPPKKREDEQRDTLFADDAVDNWGHPLENQGMPDDDHYGADFVDLERERIDALCDSLFHGDSAPNALHEQCFRVPLALPVTPALDERPQLPPSLGAGLPTSPTPRPQVSVRWAAPTTTDCDSVGTAHPTNYLNNLATDASVATLTKRSTRTNHRPVRLTTRPNRQTAANIRSRFGQAVLLLCTLFAAFCFYQHALDNDISSLPIERIHPADKVLVDAPQEALATDFARLTDRQLDWNASDGSFTVAGVADPLRELADPSAEAIRRADYRLLVLQAKEAWDDGTYNEVNVRTLQPWQWVHEHEVHVGGYAPLPLDTLEMGLPEGMTGKVIDILPCPPIKSGRGRVVLTTINRLARGVIELTLRDSRGQEETLRPTGEHLFYSVTQGEWLSAEELQPGEHLDGIKGTVTVTAITTLPGTHRVYNLSVQGEHLYRVAKCGVLVHNNYAAGGAAGRPSPRQSELDVSSLNPNHRSQVSFRNGREVPYASRGSVRPDNFRVGDAIEVKNYDLLQPSNRANLYNTIHGQYLQRVSNLPKGTHQRVVIDIRGQNVPESLLIRVRSNIQTITRTPDVSVEFLR
jgi:YD repeat-containing protein